MNTWMSLDPTPTYAKAEINAVVVHEAEASLN